jgi:regulator of sigma E protease
VGETRDVILKTYLTLRRLTIDRTVSPSKLMGPVGMLHSGSFFASKGTDWLIWFLAIVSANLAVVNFLPIPPLDGWHFAGMVYESLTGQPPSARVQNAAVTAGVVLLLCFVLFVTYHDLARAF